MSGFIAALRHASGKGLGHVPGLVALLAILSVTLGACSKQREHAALQTALDELTKLDSYSQTGVSYAQYSDQLSTAKANIDVALQRSTDSGAKAKIEAALQHYIQARDWWKESPDVRTSTSSEISERHYWSDGSSAILEAKQYAFADEKTRREIDAKNAQKEAARRQLERKEAARRLEQQQKKAKEMLPQQRAADAKRAAEDAERKRRFAPDGIVYNLKQLTVTLQAGLASVPPGTELRVAQQNSDGTLHVQKDDLFADVQPSDVTNDRDLAAALRARDSAEQEAVRQWIIKQGAAAAELERWKYATPTPRPR